MQSDPRTSASSPVMSVKTPVSLLVKPTELGQGGHGGGPTLVVLVVVVVVAAHLQYLNQSFAP